MNNELNDFFQQEQAKRVENGQKSLGYLIDALSGVPSDYEIYFDFCNAIPGSLDSYRGDYSELAMSYTTDSSKIVTVGNFLQHCKDILNTKLEGYKGGEFLMTADTPIWVANHGRTSDTALSGVTVYSSMGVVILHTMWQTY